MSGPVYPRTALRETPMPAPYEDSEWRADFEPTARAVELLPPNPGSVDVEVETDDAPSIVRWYVLTPEERNAARAESRRNHAERTAQRARRDALREAACPPVRDWTQAASATGVLT